MISSGGELRLEDPGRKLGAFERPPPARAAEPPLRRPAPSERRAIRPQGPTARGCRRSCRGCGSRDRRASRRPAASDRATGRRRGRPRLRHASRRRRQVTASASSETRLSSGNRLMSISKPGEATPQVHHRHQRLPARHDPSLAPVFRQQIDRLGEAARPDVINSRCFHERAIVCPLTLCCGDRAELQHPGRLVSITATADLAVTAYRDHSRE